MNRLLTLFGLCILTTGVFAQSKTTSTRVVTPKNKTAETLSTQITSKKLPIVIKDESVDFVIEDDIMKQDEGENQGENGTEETNPSQVLADNNVASEETGHIAKTRTQQLEESINIFPLPAKDYFNISIENHLIEDYTLINAKGQIVFNEVNTNQQNIVRIETNQLTRGIYFVMLNTSNGRISKSIIIQ